MESARRRKLAIKVVPGLTQTNLIHKIVVDAAAVPVRNKLARSGPPKRLVEAGLVGACHELVEQNLREDRPHGRGPVS